MLSFLWFLYFTTFANISLKPKFFLVSTYDFQVFLGTCCFCIVHVMFFSLIEANLKYIYVSTETFAYKCLGE